MLEKEMRRLLKYYSKKQIPNILMQRIESGSTGIGIPDFYFKTTKEEGWIELKEIKGNVSREAIIRIPYRPGQYNWLRNYTQLNGNAILICSIDKAWYCFKGDYIQETYIYEDLHTFCQQFREVSELNFPHLLQNPYT